MYLALVGEICRKRPFSETGLDNEESEICRKRPLSETDLNIEEYGFEDVGDGLGDQEFDRCNTNIDDDALLLNDAFLVELMTEQLQEEEGVV